jgi:hypothetical protein
MDKQVSKDELKYLSEMMIQSLTLVVKAANQLLSAGNKSDCSEEVIKYFSGHQEHAEGTFNKIQEFFTIPEIVAEKRAEYQEAISALQKAQKEIAEVFNYPLGLWERNELVEIDRAQHFVEAQSKVTSAETAMINAHQLVLALN